MQEFTISELKKKVIVEDRIKKLEAELDEKDKTIMEKDQQILMMEEKISDLSEFTRKTGNNFNKNQNELSKAQSEIEDLQNANLELNTEIEKLNSIINKRDEKLLENEEYWNAKYHALLRQFNDLESKSKDESTQNDLKKELSHFKALSEDLSHEVEKKQLRVETLEKLEKQLRSKISQNEGDFLVQHQSSCKQLCFKMFDISSIQCKKLMN